MKTTFLAIALALCAFAPLREAFAAKPVYVPRGEAASVTESAAPDAAATALAETDATDAPDEAETPATAPAASQAPADPSAGATPAALASRRVAWYDKFSAVEGSTLFWILHTAREKAERGESTEELEAAFDAVVALWLAEDEED